MALALRPVPLPQADVLRIGAGVLVLVVGGFLPCFSEEAGRIALNSYGVDVRLRSRLDAGSWADIEDAREKAWQLRQWPSRYRALRLLYADRRLDEDVRIRLGVLRDSKDWDAFRWLEAVFLTGLWIGFVYGSLVVGWAAVRLIWSGHPALDATIVSAALFLGLTDSIVLVGLSFLQGGAYVHPRLILLLILPAVWVAASSYLAARRPGYWRVFLGTGWIGLLYCSFMWIAASKAGALDYYGR